MAKYRIEIEDLTEQSFREARAKMVAEAYRKRIAQDENTARTTIMMQMSMAMGITPKTIRSIVEEAGLETALKNYANCGAKSADEASADALGTMAEE